MTVTIIAQAKDKDAPAPDKSAVARKAMVDNQIRTNDVTDPALVAALRDTPREPHLPVAQQAAAYVDRALPLTATRGLNPPLTTARLIADAQVRAGQSVLLIGAATGYAAALLARMGAIVTAVEDDPALVAIARDALHGRGGITVIDAPLVAGAPVAAPYDCLIVDGAIAALPTALPAQLRPGARIACGLAGGPVRAGVVAAHVDSVRGQAARGAAPALTQPGSTGSAPAIINGRTSDQARSSSAAEPDSCNTPRRSAT